MMPGKNFGNLQKAYMISVDMCVFSTTHRPFIHKYSVPISSTQALLICSILYARQGQAESGTKKKS